MFHDDDERSFRDSALVCQNGHVINSSASKYPEDNKRFCNKCGGQAVSQCPSCANPIEGSLYTRGLPSLSAFHPPRYCHNCGKPFPWTEARIRAAQELVDLTEVSEADKESLKASVPALASDTPQSTVAAAKWKRFLVGGGMQVADAGRSILVEIASESVKKILWPR